MDFTLVGPARCAATPLASCRGARRFRPRPPPKIPATGPGRTGPSSATRCVWGSTADSAASELRDLVTTAKGYASAVADALVNARTHLLVERPPRRV